MLSAAEAGGRAGSVIEILALQALAHAAQGDVAQGLAPLRRALALAGPEGYVRLFVDEGAPMAALLREAERRGIEPDYARRLLGAFGQPAASLSAAQPDAQPTLEPLSAREREVLTLLRTELSGPEIARELMVSSTPLIPIRATFMASSG